VLRVPEAASDSSRVDRSAELSSLENAAPRGRPFSGVVRHLRPAIDPYPTTDGLQNTPPPVFVRRQARRRRKSTPSFVDKLSAWQGLIPRPHKPEAKLWKSLLYPFWDVDGLLFLVIFSILWWLLTFIPFSLVVDGVVPGGPLAILLAPLLLGHLLAFGYTLLYLREVLVTSAAGDVRHPRWSAIDPYEIIRGLSRWFWAFLIGGVLGLFPAVWYWIRCGTVDMLDWIVLVDLILPGVAYGQMALVASLLLDDPLGANPITVCQALWRVGLRSLQPALVVSFALMLAGGLSILIVTIPIPILALFMLWIFLSFVLYEALVVMRILGLEYRRQARKIGWFRASRRRSV
jgi:hypothetical protein